MAIPSKSLWLFPCWFRISDDSGKGEITNKTDGYTYIFYSLPSIILVVLLVQFELKPRQELRNGGSTSNGCFRVDSVIYVISFHFLFKYNTMWEGNISVSCHNWCFLHLRTWFDKTRHIRAPHSVCTISVNSFKGRPRCIMHVFCLSMHRATAYRSIHHKS
jgi:hypothetical protein